MGRHVVSYHNLGQPLEYIYPPEGVVVVPQPMVGFSKAPHPNAAKLFIDFFRSEQGQLILYESNPLHSGREGLPHIKDATLDTLLRKAVPLIGEFSAIPMDFKKITSEDIAKATEEWISVFRKK